VFWTVNLYYLFVYIEQNGTESPKDCHFRVRIIYVYYYVGNKNSGKIQAREEECILCIWQVTIWKSVVFFSHLIIFWKIKTWGLRSSGMLDSAKWQSVSGVPYSAMSKKREHFNCIAVRSLKDRPDGRWLSSWNRGLLEKFAIPQAVKKLPAFYGSRMFNFAFKNARHLSVTWTTSTQCTPTPLTPQSFYFLMTYLLQM
jgi:hypothetical protein